MIIIHDHISHQITQFFSGCLIVFTMQRYCLLYSTNILLSLRNSPGVQCRLSIQLPILPSVFLDQLSASTLLLIGLISLFILHLLTTNPTSGISQTIIYGYLSHTSTATFIWRRGVVVTELVVSTKLLYIEPG